MSIQFPSMPRFYGPPIDVLMKVEQPDAEHQVVSPQEKGKKESLTLPDMPPKVPSQTKESQALSVMGEKILEMDKAPQGEKAPQGDKAQVEGEVLSKKLEDPLQVGNIAVTVTTKVTGIVEEHENLTELSEADLGLAVSCLEDAASLAQIGMLTLKITEKSQAIDKAKTELNLKQEKMGHLTKELAKAKKEGNTEKVAPLQDSVKSLEEKIRNLTHKIKIMEEEKENLTKDLVISSIKAGLGAIQEGTDYAEKLQEVGEKVRAGAHAGAEVPKGAHAVHHTVSLAHEAAKGGGQAVSQAHHMVPVAHEAAKALTPPIHPIVQEAAKGAADQIQALSVAGAVTGSVLSVISVALSSKALIENREIAKKIMEKKETVLKQLENHKNDPFMTKVLTLRLQNLERQYEENAILTVKNALSLTAGVLGGAAAAKTVALAVGATVSATLGTAFAVTGVGAMAMGSAALLIGTGYLVYKNRHAIQNKLQNLNISRKEYLREREIKQLQGERAEIQEKYVASSKAYERTKIYEKATEGGQALWSRVEDVFQERIAELLEEMDKFQKEKAELERVKTPSLKKDPINRRIKELESQIQAGESQIREIAREKTRLALSRAQVQVRSHYFTEESMTRMSETDSRIMGKTEELRELNTRRNDINDAYEYGQDVAKFGKGADGEEMTWEKLREAHIFLHESANAESLEKMKELFIEQHGEVDVSDLKEGIDSKKLWNFVTKMVTAPVK